MSQLNKGSVLHMNCKTCVNNKAKDKEGYVFCEKSLLKQTKITYNEEKKVYECDKEKSI